MRISDFVQASLIACHLPMTGEYVTVQPVTTGVANALGYALALVHNNGRAGLRGRYGRRLVPLPCSAP